MTQERYLRHSFIIRIWQEGDSQDWKGWVKHANSGDSIQIKTITDLLTFIEQKRCASDLPEIDGQAGYHQNPKDSNLT